MLVRVLIVYVIIVKNKNNLNGMNKKGSRRL